MNNALKISDIQENSSQLNARDVSTTENLTNLNTDEIRAKIKAARLEKLMARQLESEFSIELDTEMEITLNEDMPFVIEEAVVIETPKAVELEIPASKTRGYSAGSSKRMRNVQTTRHSCDEMVSRIRTGSEIMSGLNEQTSNLVNQLQFMEQEFVRFEEAEEKATKLAFTHKRVVDEYEEALNLIEKQNRQLDVLESQRANTSANYEATKADLEKLQRQAQKDTDLIAESLMINSELEQQNRSIIGKLSASETAVTELTFELKTTNSTLKQKDMEAARAKADLMSAKERLNNSEESLDQTSQELEVFAKNFTAKEIELQTTKSELSSIKEKFSVSDASLERTTRDLENLTQDVHDKDMQSAKLTSDYSSLIKSNSKVMTDLDNIQNKYDELNKSALEQQSQQYARIHELESILRDTKRQFELKSKANTELSVELEATNNLLILHEEMVNALSPENRK